LTFTDVAADVALHPAVVMVTVYDPAKLAAMVCVVAPLLHRYVFAVGADKVTLVPLQILVEPAAVMVATGIGFTVTVVIADVAVHPLEPVKVTVCVPFAPTVIVGVFAPLLQA
jgi:hypothetical protein